MESLKSLILDEAHLAAVKQVRLAFNASSSSYEIFEFMITAISEESQFEYEFFCQCCLQSTEA